MDLAYNLRVARLKGIVLKKGHIISLCVIDDLSVGHVTIRRLLIGLT